MTAPDSPEYLLGPVVADNVRRLREAKGLSKEDLARDSGVAVELVEEIEAGRSGQLPALELEAIADGLDADVTDLLRVAPKDA